MTRAMGVTAAKVQAGFSTAESGIQSNVTSFEADQRGRTGQDDAVRPKSVFHKSRRHAALLRLTVSRVTELASFPDPIENRPLEHEQLQQ